MCLEEEFIMYVNEVMTSNAECTQPMATLQEVAQRMKELDVGSMPVCDSDRLAGMITDRDIAVRAVAEGGDVSTMLVRDVMTSRVIYCFEDQDIAEAAEIMQQEQVRRLPVLNREKRMVGIVSLGDLAVTANERLTGETLEAISEPAGAAH
jgi:CBS domain-containing protein